MGVSIQLYRQRIGQFRNNGKIFFTKCNNHRRTPTLSAKSLFVWTFFLINNFTSGQFATSETDFMCFCVSSSTSRPMTAILSDIAYFSHRHSYTKTDIIENNFSTIGLSWSYSCPSYNKLCHSLCGNRRIGYKIAFWNCRRKLLLLVDS